MKSNIFFLSGEESSALYLREFMLQLPKEVFDSVMFWGVGPRGLPENQFESIYFSDEMAAVGLWEIAPKISFYRQALRRILEEVERRNPRLVVLMDFPGFNFRLLRYLQPFRKSGLKIVYWIPPQIWAWRSGRVKVLKSHVDVVVSILPFEQEFLRKNQVASVYLGHPLVERIRKFSREDRVLLRSRRGWGSQWKVLGCFPGSRKTEIIHHWPVFREACRLLIETQKIDHVVVGVPSNQKDLRSMIDKHPLGGSYQVIEVNEVKDWFSGLDFAITKSGTISLELGLSGVPSIIAYKLLPLSYAILRPIVGNPRPISLTNRILGKTIYPELIQSEVTAAKILRSFEDLLKNKSFILEELMRLRGILEIQSQGCISSLISHIPLSTEKPGSPLSDQQAASSEGRLRYMPLLWNNILKPLVGNLN